MFEHVSHPIMARIDIWSSGYFSFHCPDPEADPGTVLLLLGRIHRGRTYTPVVLFA